MICVKKPENSVVFSGFSKLYAAPEVKLHESFLVKTQSVLQVFSHLTIFFSNFSDSGSGSAADKVSFADLRKQKARDQFHSSGINITYTEQEKEDVPKKSTGSLLSSRRDSQQSQRLPQTESSTASTTSEGHQTSPGPGKTGRFLGRKIENPEVELVNTNMA